MDRNSDDHEGGISKGQLLFFSGVKREPAPNTCAMGCKRRPKCKNDSSKGATHD
jgi:hypothetical protein